MVQEQLAQAIELARAGHKQQARELLIGIVRQDKYNVSAWKWLATVAGSPSEARQAIDNILTLDSEDAWASRALDSLNAYSQQQPTARPRKRRTATIIMAASLGVAVIALAAIAALSLTNSTVPGAQATTPDAGNPQQSDLLFTPDPSLLDVANAPTLPPSWTPSVIAQLPTFAPPSTQTPTNIPLTSTQFPTRTPGFFDLPSDQPPLQQTDGPFSASQPVVETQTILFYPVTGSNANEINQSLLDHGPKGAGQDAIAQIQYSIALQYALGQSANSCSPHQAAALFDMVITYPEYIAPAGVAPEILAQWDDFFVRVVAHEETHAQIARECAENLVTSFNQLSATQTCDELQSTIEAIQFSNDQACEDRQIAYDLTAGGDSFP